MIAPGRSRAARAVSHRAIWLTCAVAVATAALLLTSSGWGGKHLFGAGAQAAAARAEASAGTPSPARERPRRISVPGGPFIQGSAKGEDDERPVRTRTLKPFVIDRTEITRSSYALCVSARRCKPVPSRFLEPVGADGNLPIVGVTWFDARDYCHYAGGRLPTEAEWEKAARGTDGREYPWGEESTCALANWGNYDGEGPCAGTNPGFPVAVGRYEAGASPYGVLDLAGNVWEWVADRYDDEPDRRVVRGGSCCSYFVPPRAANRNAWDAGYRDTDLGFRCAADR